MCVSLTLISMGSTCGAESSSRKRARLRNVDIKKLARYPWRRSCRKPLRSASGEWAAAQGPLARRARTSGLWRPPTEAELISLPAVREGREAAVSISISFSVTSVERWFSWNTLRPDIKIHPIWKRISLSFTNYCHLHTLNLTVSSSFCLIHFYPAWDLRCYFTENADERRWNEKHIFQVLIQRSHVNCSVISWYYSYADKSAGDK